MHNMHNTLLASSSILLLCIICIIYTRVYLLLLICMCILLEYSSKIKIVTNVSYCSSTITSSYCNKGHRPASACPVGPPPPPTLSQTTNSANGSQTSPPTTDIYLLPAQIRSSRYYNVSRSNSRIQRKCLGYYPRGRCGGCRCGWVPWHGCRILSLHTHVLSLYSEVLHNPCIQSFELACMSHKLV